MASDRAQSYCLTTKYCKGTSVAVDCNQYSDVLEKQACTEACLDCKRHCYCPGASTPQPSISPNNKPGHSNNPSPSTDSPEKESDPTGLIIGIIAAILLIIAVTVVVCMLWRKKRNQQPVPEEHIMTEYPGFSPYDTRPPPIPILKQPTVEFTGVGDGPQPQPY